MVARLLVVLGLLATTAPLRANVAPMRADGACRVIQTRLQDERAFPTVIATVAAMAQQHLDASLRMDREYVGAVLQDREGRFWAAVGAGCPGRDTVTFSVRIPAGLRVSAFWHTHGAAGAMRDWFSPDDVELVQTTRYDFYLITPAGALRVLTYDDVQRGVRAPMRQLTPGIPRGATAGRTVVVPAEPDERVTARGRARAADAPV